MANKDPFENLSKQDKVNSEQATKLLKGLTAEHVIFDTKAHTVCIHFAEGKEFKVINLDSIMDVLIETSSS